MDYQQFAHQLPDLYYNWGQETVRPKSEQFQAVLQSVQGMSTPNVLQLLNAAVACMEPGEVYCEVGCFRGSTLIGALLNHPDRMAYAVDNFSEFDFSGENALQLQANLAKFNLTEQVFFCNQDFEAFFADMRSLEFADRIGVYLYDGAHDYRSQLMGLLLVKPFLADRALIIVDDSNWMAVQQANWDFIAAHPQCQLLLDLPTPAQNYDQMSSCSFWNGLQILSWDIHANHQPHWSALAAAQQPQFLQPMYQLGAKFAQAPANSRTIQQAQALQLRHSGQLAAAAQCYQDLVQQDDQCAESWHGLGVTNYLMSRWDEAFRALSKAVALDDTIATYHYSLGLLLEKMGDIGAAARAYQQAIALDDSLVDAQTNLGNLVLEHGDAHQAELIYRQTTARHPNHSGTYLNLGNALIAQGKVDEAIAIYQTVLQQELHNAAVLENLAVAETLQQHPDQLQQLIGDRCYRQKRYTDALQHYESLSGADTLSIAVYMSLADCYQQVDQPDRAIQTYQDGLVAHPQAASLHLALILALQNAGRLPDAIAAADVAVQMLPDDLSLRMEAARLLPIIYQTSAEIATSRQRFAQKLHELVQQMPLQTAEQRLSALQGVGQHTNFLLSYQGQDDRDLQMQYGALVHSIMAANYPQWVQPLSMPSRSPAGKIRIGYVSSCLWSHTVGKLMVGWLRHHDPNAFEIYSYNVGECFDQLTETYRAYSDIFYQIPNNLEAVCRQIAANQLHVLVFLDIGMQGLMTQLAGLRLAPVQCTTWGHPVTSGSPTVDYFLSSDLMEPENAQTHYSEKLVRLPNIGIAYAQPEIPPPTKSRADFGLREDAIVYLACQLLCKFLPQHDYLFAAIAQQVPQAQFVFLSRPTNAYVAAQFQQRLERVFTAVGLDSRQHCVMLPPQVQADYWDLNQVSDVFLDSLAWSGGHTTLEAIACGLPVVTCPGEFMRGRHSYAILTMLGMTETIAQTEQRYIDIAVRLGRDAVWRQQIMAQMAARYGQLYDDTTCVKALEAFYRQVVEG